VADSADENDISYEGAVRRPVPQKCLLAGVPGTGKTALLAAALFTTGPGKPGVCFRSATDARAAITEARESLFRRSSVSNRGRTGQEQGSFQVSSRFGEGRSWSVGVFDLTGPAAFSGAIAEASAVCFCIDPLRPRPEIFQDVFVTNTSSEPPPLITRVLFLLTKMDRVISRLTLDRDTQTGFARTFLFERPTERAVAQSVHAEAQVKEAIGAATVDLLRTRVAKRATCAFGISSAIGFEAGGEIVEKDPPQLRLSRLMWTPFGVLEAFTFLTTGRALAPIRKVG
jgi:hypothetical protein